MAIRQHKSFLEEFDEGLLDEWGYEEYEGLSWKVSITEIDK